MNEFEHQDSLFPCNIDYSHCIPERVDSAMNPLFLNKVKVLSDRLGGITINSQYRTVAWEYSRSRSGSSQHCKGLAVDISCKDSQFRRKLIQEALNLDFHRILIYPTFVHLDDKVSLPRDRRDIIWMKG